MLACIQHLLHALSEVLHAARVIVIDVSRNGDASSQHHAHLCAVREGAIAVGVDEDDPVSGVAVEELHETLLDGEALCGRVESGI